MAEQVDTSGSYIIGVAIVFSACFVQSLGINLQRWALIDKSRQEPKCRNMMQSPSLDTTAANEAPSSPLLTAIDVSTSARRMSCPNLGDAAISGSSNFRREGSHQSLYRTATLQPGYFTEIIADCEPLKGQAVIEQGETELFREACHLERDYKRNLIWMLGLFFYALSQICGSLLALNFLSTLIVAPLGAFTLLCNAVLAKIMFGTRLGAKSIIGTALVTLGAVLVAVFSDTGVVPIYTLESLRLLWGNAIPQIYALILQVISLALFGLAFMGVPKFRFNDNSLQEEREPLLSSNHFSVRTIPITTHAISLQQKGLLYAVLAALLASETLILAKSGVELVRLTILGLNQFTDAFSFLIVAGLVISAALQVVFLNASITYCSTVLIVPLFFATFNVLSFVNALVFFDQWAHIGLVRGLVLVGSLIILISGVQLLSYANEEIVTEDQLE